MKRLSKILGFGILLPLVSSTLATAKDAAPAKTKVFDLNQVDLEQVEDNNWDNSSPNNTVNLNRGPKIKDIVEPTSEYTYASFGKPDPFAMPDFTKGLDAKAAADEAAEAADTGPMSSMGPAGKEIAIQSPLQAYPIDALVVKGVWQLSTGEMRAVILTPKSEGIVVKNGDPMSSGKVLQIEKESIVVRLYRLRKDGVREYEDKRINFGADNRMAKGTIKLEPGKAAQFPGMEGAPPEAAAADGKKAPPAFPPVPKAAQKMDKAMNEMADVISDAVKEAKAAKAAATPTPAPGTAPPAPAAGAAGNPPGWPYNMTPPAPAAAPSSGRPGSSK
jgi:Tfp pilus assembly protein PilP